MRHYHVNEENQAEVTKLAGDFLAQVNQHRISNLTIEKAKAIYTSILIIKSELNNIITSIKNNSDVVYFYHLLHYYNNAITQIEKLKHLGIGTILEQDINFCVGLTISDLDGTNQIIRNVDHLIKNTEILLSHIKNSNLYYFGHEIIHTKIKIINIAERLEAGLILDDTHMNILEDVLLSLKYPVNNDLSILLYRFSNDIKTYLIEYHCE